VGRSGAQAEPQPGLLGIVDPPGIDDDEFRAVFQLLVEVAADLAFLVGGRGIAGKEQDQLRGIVEIRHGIEAAGMDPGDLSGGVTDVLGGDDVGGAEEIGEADENEMFQPLGHPDAEGDAPGPVLLFDLIQSRRRFRQGVRPGEALPFPRSSLPYPLYGIFEPVGMIEALRGEAPFGAGVTPVEVPVGISFNLGDPAVLHADQQGAAAMIPAGAVGLEPFDIFSHNCILFPGGTPAMNFCPGRAIVNIIPLR